MRYKRVLPQPRPQRNPFHCVSGNSYPLTQWNGVILIDKPGGITSHDVVHFIRKRFGYKKVGHAGTLDPMASGLLIILLGSFTKKSDHFMNYDKEYEARIFFGVSTDTGDAEGSVTGEKAVSQGVLTGDNVESALNFFRGAVLQVPPMYSAKKINGRKLYELARKGLTVTRRPREIYIKELKVIGLSPPELDIYVRCSKGTYIRQLAEDIGKKIGCGAHLSVLRRTAIGHFRLHDAVAFSRISAGEGFYENILQPA